ncbi:MAG: DUF1343 domain-containing protein [Parafilimonas sp.]
MKKFLILCFLGCMLTVCSLSQDILPGAWRTFVYVPLLKDKRVAVFANQTSMIGNIHLVDSLQKLGVNITKIFAPEHGFRGNADAGEKVKTYIDEQSGIKVISLYGKKLKPSAEDLADVDVLLFDIQDVGVRFYTFISSLQYFMEAAFENSKALMILDRPNPNGFYIDGPVLDTAYKSFIGMQPVPVVYGMTIGEYAFMIAGEQWLSSEAANKKYEYYRNANNSADTPFHFLVIKCANYTHESKYALPVKPSPNLRDMQSVYWYPSTCFFEGTLISEGRGTEHPFCIFGDPALPDNLYAFTPVANEGAKEPKFKDQLCYGWNVYTTNSKALLSQLNEHLNIEYLLKAYALYPDKENFFIKPQSERDADYFFNKLAGNNILMQQIKEGKTAKQIYQSWKPALEKFKKIRKKYLLYPDF